MIELRNAVEEVTRQIKNDPDLYYAYQANIAMAFKDEYDRQANERQYIDLGKLDIHEIANQAAKNFLDLWTSPLKEETK